MDSPHTLVLCFADRSFGHNNGPLAELRAAYPNSHIAGCSTAGEIIGASVQDNTMVVAVAHLPQSSIKIQYAGVSDPSKSRDMAQQIAESLAAPDLSGVLALSDGLHVNGTALTAGFCESLPEGVPVSGGLAGDGDRFERTWVLREGRPEQHIVAGIGLYGSELALGHGSQGGWDVFGVERTITRSAGNTLYELDGHPALDLYREYLGERAKDLPATGLLFPLSIRGPASEQPVVRTILGVNDEEKSLTFAGDVPCGWSARLMKANFDRLVDGASRAASLVTTIDNEPASLSLAISCVGRKLVLGERVEEEVEATLDRLPESTQQIGFYSYGEISPLVGGSGCELHNQTMTLTHLVERSRCRSTPS